MDAPAHVACLIQVRLIGLIPAEQIEVKPLKAGIKHHKRKKG